MKGGGGTGFDQKGKGKDQNSYNWSKKVSSALENMGQPNKKREDTAKNKRGRVGMKVKGNKR